MRTRSPQAWIAGGAGLLAAVLAASACADGTAMLSQLLEARQLAPQLHLEFTKASDAANRAVMSDTDEGSAAAAEESRRARQTVEKNVARLQPLLQSLGFAEETGYLEEFKKGFDEYRRLDDEILPLAVENSNLKAQRLSFGPAREAADAFRTSLDAAVRSGASKDRCRDEVLATRAQAAVLEIQVLQAPHIAEPEDDVMTHIEEQMRAADRTAEQALEQLKAGLGPAGAPHLAAGAAALDRFQAVNKEIIALSRRNSNVRSLALSLGRKRTLTAYCDDRLQALEQALATHRFTATR